MCMGSKLTPPWGSQFYIKLYRENFKRFHSWTANGNLTGMVPVWCLTKNVKMVMIGFINRSRGKKTCFQNTIFKNLLVWNYTAQSFHIWYIASSRGSLPNYAPVVKIDSAGGNNFTLNYKRKRLNDFFSCTYNWN